MGKEHRPKAARWGWGILLVTASLFAVNGISWIFFGPDAVVADTAEHIGVSVAEFEVSYPAAVDGITVNQYQVATYLIAIGIMGFLAALAGYRLGFRWAWRITWVLVIVPAALAVAGIAAGFGVGGFLTMMLLLAIVALTGQILCTPTSGSGMPSGTDTVAES